MGEVKREKKGVKEGREERSGRGGRREREGRRKGNISFIAYPISLLCVDRTLPILRRS